MGLKAGIFHSVLNEWENKKRMCEWKRKNECVKHKEKMNEWKKEGEWENEKGKSKWKRRGLKNVNKKKEGIRELNRKEWENEKRKEWENEKKESIYE